MKYAIRLAASALIEDFLAEYPTLGFEEIDAGAPDAEDATELLERLLTRHRLELVDMDDPAWQAR